MQWTVALSSRAQKDLRRLPARDRNRVAAALEAMRTDPLSGDVVKLKGQAAFRRRVGEYRILFDIEFRSRTARVFAVLRRSTTTYR